MSDGMMLTNTNYITPRMYTQTLLSQPINPTKYRAMYIFIPSHHKEEWLTQTLARNKTVILKSAAGSAGR
jgi:hypothetical protein